jgi:hypothetical protein
MIFRTCEHYDINNKKYENSECFICYEIKDEENQFPSKLSRQTYYIKKCSCDVFVHDVCLKKWHLIHHNCPICRLHMEVNIEKSVFIYFIDHCNNSMENILSIIRFIMIIFFIYYVFKRSVKFAKMVTILHYVKETKTEYNGFLEN